jgi:hypothetical protein
MVILKKHLFFRTPKMPIFKDPEKLGFSGPPKIAFFRTTKNVDF